MKFAILFVILSCFYLTVIGGGSEMYQDERMSNLFKQSELIWNFSKTAIEAFTMAHKILEEQVMKADELFKEKDSVDFLYGKYQDHTRLRAKGRFDTIEATAALEAYTQFYANREMWMEKYNEQIKKTTELAQECNRASKHMKNKINESTIESSVFLNPQRMEGADEKAIDESELLINGPGLIKISEKILQALSQENPIEKDNFNLLLAEYKKIVGPNCLLSFGIRAEHLLNTVKWPRILKLQHKIDKRFDSLDLDSLDLGLEPTKISVDVEDYQTWLGKDEL